MSKKKQWVKWLKSYGPDRFFDAFMHNVEGAQSVCSQCRQRIYVDISEGGGIADWSTEDGDFGCNKSPDTNDEGVGSHMPVRKLRK